MKEDAEELKPIELTVAEQTADLCKHIIELKNKIGFTDTDMAKLTDMSNASWKAISLGYYPEDFDFGEFTRLSGLIECLTLALRAFTIGDRVRSWMHCKNLAIYNGDTTPFEAIARFDDLEAVHEVLVMGDPNTLLPEDLEDVA